MKVFISWSGSRSRRAAAALHEWLETVMPNAITLWMSDTDLEKGTHWASGIGESLGDADAGMSILTPENLTSPWLNFEAGAIRKAFGQSRVMTFLIGLGPGDVPQPLGQLQHTSRTKADVLRMVTDLNKLSETPIPELMLTRQVERLWPDLEKALKKIENDAPPTASVRRGTYEMLEEALTLLRGLSREPRDVGALTPQPLPNVDIGGLNDREMRAEESRTLSIEQARHFTDQAFEDIVATIGQEAANRISMLFDPTNKTIVVVLEPEQRLPDELLRVLRGRAEARQLKLDILRSDHCDDSD